MRFWAFAFLLSASCLPTPADILGKACDPDHLGCGPQLVCRAGVCASPDGGTDPDGGPTPFENLLSNGGFDAVPNGLLGWGPASSGGVFELSTSVYRSASPSVRVYANPGSADPYISLVLDRTALPSPASSGNSGKTYCAESWVREGAFSVRVTMYLRRFNRSGSPEDSADVPESHLFTSDAGLWTPLRASLTATAPYDQSMIVRIYSPRVAGGDFYVDDVRVWISPDGGCP